ncbi:unnamed protein product [Brassica rapa subsp. trilocularis]
MTVDRRLFLVKKVTFLYITLQVRVRHMIMKPVEDIYPKWDNDKIYTDVDNMLKDILNGQLNEKFWNAMPTTKCEKRKYGVAASVVAAHNVAISGLAELLKILTAKVEGIDVSVADKVTKALDATIDSKVEARLRVYDSDLRKQIAKLEAQINDSKNNAGVNIAPDVTTSKAYEDEDDGACSNDLINSQDGLPVDCVVKKEKKDKKAMDSTPNLTNKEVIKTEKKAGIPLRRVKQEKAFAIPQLNDESISSKDFENHLQWEKSVICRATKASVDKDSKEPYDQLAKAEAEKLQKVLDFIKSDLEAKEPCVGDDSAGFFLKLMIPRDDWPTKNYGWLHDSLSQCLCFTDGPGKNNLCIPLLDRIAFMSHWFVNSWVNDYKNWDQNMTELSEMYIKAMENTRLILSRVISGLLTSTIFSSATMLTEITGFRYASICRRQKFMSMIVFAYI